MAEIGIERAPRGPRLLGIVALVLGAAALVLLFLSGPVVRFGGAHFRTGFQLMTWAAYAGIAAVVVGIAAAVFALSARRRRALVPAVLGVAMGATAFYLPWSWRNEARGYPGIHDITTDPGNPPPFVAVLPLRADAPNSPEYAGDSVAAVQRESYPEVQPLMMAMPVDSAFTLAATAAREMSGWRLVDQDRASGRIEATAVTPWFGFQDDVVIRVSSASGISRVDVRSKSRVGRGDVGANAKRIRAYLDRLRAMDPAPVQAE